MTFFFFNWQNKFLSSLFFFLTKRQIIIMQFKHVRNIKKIQVISNESHVGKWPFENSRLKGN